jgi:hypothetical protein
MEMETAPTTLAPRTQTRTPAGPAKTTAELDRSWTCRAAGLLATMTSLM